MLIKICFEYIYCFNIIELLSCQENNNGKVNVTRKKKALFPETLTLSQSLVSYTVGLTLLTIKLAKE